MSELNALPTVGFIGLGNMGSPMAARLSDAGYVLHVVDVDPQTTDAFVRTHKTAVASTLKPLGECRVVFLMLPNSDIVEQTVAGEDGLLAQLKPSAVIVDMGSSVPTRTVELQERAGQVEVDFFDAPVTGGVTRAEDGTLTIMTGGSGEAAALARPLLELMGTNIVQTGPVGSAHAAKALNNLLSATGLIAAGEVLLVAQKFGITPERMLNVLNGGSGRNNSTEKKFVPFVLSRTFDSGFGFSLMLKDLGIALSLADDTGTEMTVGSKVLELCQLASETLPAGSDHTAVVTFLEERSGSVLKATTA